MQLVLAVSPSRAGRSELPHFQFIFFVFGIAFGLLRPSLTAQARGLSSSDSRLIDLVIGFPLASACVHYFEPFDLGTAPITVHKKVTDNAPRWLYRPPFPDLIETTRCRAR